MPSKHIDNISELMPNRITYTDRLKAAITHSNSHLCVGLDPEPSNKLWNFYYIIDETAQYAAAYKLNFAYFEALGRHGYSVLNNSIEYIRQQSPYAIIIGDAKRGDVPHTVEKYVHALYEVWDVDAATINPWGGYETILPWIHHDKKKGAYIWCYSSSKGATDFQADCFTDLAIFADDNNVSNNVGLVIGPHIGIQRTIKILAPNVPRLIPGIGAQGGSLDGIPIDDTTLVNASRTIATSPNISATAEYYRDVINSTEDNTLKL